MNTYSEEIIRVCGIFGYIRDRIIVLREETYPDIIKIPTGTIKPEETPMMCAQREFLEETGYVLGFLELLYKGIMGQKNGKRLEWYIYAACIIGGLERPEEGVIEIKQITPEEFKRELKKQTDLRAEILNLVYEKLKSYEERTLMKIS